MWRINESQTLILKIVKKNSQIVYIERVLQAIFIGIHNKVENFKYIFDSFKITINPLFVEQIFLWKDFYFANLETESC